MNDKKSFILYFDSLPLFLMLPVEQRGWLITALILFASEVAEDLEVTWEEVAERFPALTEDSRFVMQFLSGIIGRDTGQVEPPAGGPGAPTGGEAPPAGGRSAVKKKSPLRVLTQRGPYQCASKTVSRVLYLTVIYLDALLPVRSSHPGSGRANLCAPMPVLLRIEFTAMSSFQSSSELLPHFSTLTIAERWRYISVALFLKSPSAGVTRYPCPMEPGLSS